MRANIYLLKSTARIIISDVDGTITKSDIMGQIAPLIGKDWAQGGVAKLFTAAVNNGCHEFLSLHLAQPYPLVSKRGRSEGKFFTAAMKHMYGKSKKL